MITMLFVIITMLHAQKHAISLTYVQITMVLPLNPKTLFLHFSIHNHLPTPLNG